MSLLRNRTHLITVRLSGDEHERLLRTCANDGARSISEFVREIILQRLSVSRSPTGLLTGDLNTVSVKLEELDVALRDLSDRIVTILGQTAVQSGDHPPRGLELVKPKF